VPGLNRASAEFRKRGPLFASRFFRCRIRSCHFRIWLQRRWLLSRPYEDAEPHLATVSFLSKTAICQPRAWLPREGSRVFAFRIPCTQINRVREAATGWNIYPPRLFLDAAEDALGGAPAEPSKGDRDVRISALGGALAEPSKGDRDVRISALGGALAEPSKGDRDVRISALGGALAEPSKGVRDVRISDGRGCRNFCILLRGAPSRHYAGVEF
jgi:hypothetical protein